MYKRLRKVLIFGIASCVIISLMSLPKLMETPQDTMSRKQPVANVTEDQTKRESHETPKIIIITAYQHSGSSFLGSIFNHHPLSVYFYEPVAALYMSTMHIHRWQSSIQLNYLHNGSRRIRSSSEREMLNHYFQKMSQCDMGALPPELCPHIWFGGKRMKCTPNCTIDYPRDFQQSMTDAETLRHTPCTAMSDSDPMKACYCRAARIVGRLGPLCRKMRLIVMKLLRYDLKHLLDMTLRNPNWILVHQIRDPRGLMNSHITRRVNITQHKVKMLSRKFCGNMAEDIAILKGVDARNSGKIMIVRYEDLAVHPYEFAGQVYQRIDERLTLEVHQWIKSVTRSDADAGKYRRANSSMTASMWRTKLPEKYLSVINEECEPLYRYFENYDDIFV